MRTLRYSINLTLDGCCDHEAGTASEELHRHSTELLEQADGLVFGRVTYQMMESAFRGAVLHEGMPEWMGPFARKMDAARKHVVSSSLAEVDWNAELVRGDLKEAIQALKNQPGKGLLTGGVKLPMALAELGLVDEFQFVVHPVVAGRGPWLFEGLSKPIKLKLVDRKEIGTGVVMMRYVPEDRT